MATISKGNVLQKYVEFSTTVTITPGSGGSVRFDCSSPVGTTRPEPQTIYAATEISIPGGSTLTAEAVGADATYTDGGEVASLQALVSEDGIPSVAALGDSITKNAHDTALTGTKSKGFGYMSQCHAYSRGAFYFGPELNFGVSGDTAAGILARTGSTSLQALVSLRPSRVHLMIGTNDINAGVPASDVMNSIRQIIDYITSAMIPVDVTPPLPRTYQMTATKRNEFSRLRQLVHAERLVRSPVLYGVTTMDEALFDRASANGDPLANTLGDGLHPVDYGAILLGRKLWDEYYGKIFRVTPRLPCVSQADAFSMANNPLGCVNTNPLLVGTGGTSGAGASGQVATGYTLARTSGSTLTLAGTKATADVGSDVQEIAIGASATGGLYEAGSFYPTSSPIVNSGLLAGQAFVAEADIEIISPVGIQNVQLQLTPQISATPSIALDGPNSGTDREIAGRKVLTTPRAICTTPGSEALYLSLKICADCTSTPSGTVRVRSLTIRPVF